MTLHDLTCSGAGLEVLLFLVPISIVPYLPSFFFGSLLMLFGVEISLSWLILSYKKASLSPSMYPPRCVTLVLHPTAQVRQLPERHGGDCSNGLRSDPFTYGEEH